MRSLGFGCLLAFAGAFGFVLSGCGERGSEGAKAEIAVSNSYLGSVVADLCGGSRGVFCLAPAGMCPGHFDISPGQVGRLGGCRLLLLFDFQRQVEDSLSRLKDKGLRTELIALPPALCVPDTYVMACRQVCDILSSEYPEREAEYRGRLEEVERRLGEVGGELLASVREGGAGGAKVLVSERQRGFAEWLGLEEVATFASSDVETASNIERCLREAKGQEVRFVIANKQEGTALARALAERLGARAVVFSNFPDGGAGALGFDGLVRGNVGALVEAAGR